MKTETNETLSFPIRVTLFRQRWYAIVLHFAEQNTDKENARKLTNDAFTDLWQQPLVQEPEEKETSLLFYVWLYIVYKVNPELQCN
jgi:hypothetical protein